MYIVAFLSFSFSGSGGTHRRPCGGEEEEEEDEEGVWVRLGGQYQGEVLKSVQGTSALSLAWSNLRWLLSRNEGHVKGTGDGGQGKRW